MKFVTYIMSLKMVKLQQLQKRLLEVPMKIVLVVPTALCSPATANTDNDAYCIISNGAVMYDWGSLNNSTTNSYGIIDKNFNHI